jgi:hypothetical protein
MRTYFSFKVVLIVLALALSAIPTFALSTNNINAAQDGVHAFKPTTSLGWNGAIVAIQIDPLEDIEATANCLINGNWGWQGTNFSVGLDQTCANTVSQLLQSADVGVIAGQLADLVEQKTEADLGIIGEIMELAGRGGTRKVSATAALLSLLLTGIGNKIDENNGPDGVCIYIYGTVGTFDPTGVKVHVKPHTGDCSQILPEPSEILNLLPVSPTVAIRVLAEEFGVDAVMEEFGADVEEYVEEALGAELPEMATQLLQMIAVEKTAELAEDAVDLAEAAADKAIDAVAVAAEEGTQQAIETATQLADDAARLAAEAARLAEEAAREAKALVCTFGLLC